MTTCISVFSVGGHIRVWILFCFIILFYLAGLFRSLVCPKAFSFGPWLVQRKSGALLWPLVGTESLTFVLYFVLSFHG
jgi:hypothetical protein